MRRAVLAAAGAVALSALGVTPALAEKTATHWTIDRDSVQLSPWGSTFRFDGTLEHFDDGQHIRSVLRGRFAGTDSVDVVWTFRDGTTFVHGFAGGAARTETLRSIDVAPDDDVVRAEVFYFRGTSEESKLFFVGDSTDSLGTCERLDRDVMNIATSNSRIEGDVRWSCLKPNELRATVRNRFTTAANRSQSMQVTIRYSSGLNTVMSVQTSSAQTQDFVGISDASRRARSVTVRLNDNGTVVERTVNFGDDK